MSFFVALNWILVLLTAFIILVNVFKDRSLLVKPSMMTILFFHIMCQWGTALEAARVQSVLPNPWIFVLLSHGFPLLGLLVSLLLGRRAARRVWTRIGGQDGDDVVAKLWPALFLSLGLLVFLFLYLSAVPFRSTGLYAIFTSPEQAALARDMSVKFLDHTFLRYGHNMVMAALVPLLAVVLFQLCLVLKKKGQWGKLLLALAGLLLLFPVASISGARSYSAILVLVILTAWLLRKGFRISPLLPLSALVVVLVFPTLLTILREGRELTLERFVQYFKNSAYQRVLIIPMETGLMHTAYAQTYGTFGVRSMPRLAGLFGVESLDVRNYIGKINSNYPKDTTTMNTAYVYAYYSYFGLLAFLPCLIGLWLLDLSLLLYQQLSSVMLVPCIAAISIATHSFSICEYTISLFSFGFLVILLLSWSIDRLVGLIRRQVPKRDAEAG